MKRLLFAVLLSPHLAQAESAQGNLLVSVTIVATCEVATTTAAAVNVNCPQQHPYNVRVSPVASVKQGVIDSSPAQSFSGTSQVTLPAVVSSGSGIAMRRSSVDAASAATPQVTLLTISY